MTTAGAVLTVDLNESGDILHPDTGQPVGSRAVPRLLERILAVPRETTDIFVFVHGWRNSRERASVSITRLGDILQERYAARPQAYPHLRAFRSLLVAVRWPSMSNPFPWGYRRIRDRAHAMTTDGHAEFVLAHILGYLNSERRAPTGDAPVLQTARGQYLHCVGHSFGGRFLAEAIMVAAEPTAPTLAWPWRVDQYPYTVDTFVVLQMATRPDDFGTRYSRLVTRSPISGPVVLTFSPADRALRVWHRLAEGVPGLGAYGATAPQDNMSVIRLPSVEEIVEIEPGRGRIVNVNAAWRYRGGRFLRPEGAHSDIWHAETANLILGLADAARP